MRQGGVSRQARLQIYMQEHTNINDLSYSVPQLPIMMRTKLIDSLPGLLIRLDHRPSGPRALTPAEESTA